MSQKKGKLSLKSQPWLISLFAVLIAHLTNQFSNIGWRPLIVPIREFLSLNATQAGTLIGIAGIVSIIAGIPAAFLCSKFGEKKILMITFFCSGVGMILLSGATTYESALLGRSVWQFFYRISLISTMAATALAVPPDFKGRAMGLNGSFANIGALSGAPLGAFVAEFFGWQKAFWVYSALLIIGILTVGFFFKPYADSDAAAKDKKNAASDMPVNTAKPKSVFLMPIAWAMAVLMFFCSTGGTITSFIPLQLADSFGVAATTAALLQTVGQGVGVAVNPLFGWIADKIGRFQALIAMCILSIVLFVGLTIPNYHIYLLCGGITHFLGVGMLNMVYACGGDLMRGRQVGAITGVTAIGTGVAQYFLATWMGQIKDATGSYFWSQIICALMSVCAIVICLCMLLYMKKNQAQEAQAKAVKG